MTQEWILPISERIWLYKNGSLVSPNFVKKFMVPHYKKVVELLHSKGVDIITLDLDGNIWKLIPLRIECGINGVMPNEDVPFSNYIY